MNAISDVPSEALTQALDDMEALLDDNDYYMDCGEWHTPQYEDAPENRRGKCSVCLAGCVMAQTLDIGKRAYRTPSHLLTEQEDKLTALDHFRRGEFQKGLEMWNVEVTLEQARELRIVWNEDARDYHQYDGPREADGFVRAMREVAEEMKNMGF